MTLALVALAVLAVAIFAFVLEPVIRARKDRTVLDAVALPEHDTDPDGDDEESIDASAGDVSQEFEGDERPSGRRVSFDRTAGSDAS